ncbi:MAG: tRNA uridine-5-carboxymethylaminomethyl(34) synthesis GTPase MnmE, partial [Bacilli bacterium]|nr:tRNA uridine-5-carboxymethylaminomethyl(34) synthesis GTPase MnmE [Bacilli bacterium]
MLNNNEELTSDIKELIDKIENKKYLVLINKIDLENKLEIEKLKVPKDKIIELSIIKEQGIESLKEKIEELFNLNELELKDPTYLSNARSISILNNCLNKMEEIEESLKNDMPIDMIELDIKNIWEELGRINGTTYEEELLDEMFKRFCLGK